MDHNPPDEPQDAEDELSEFNTEHLADYDDDDADEEPITSRKVWPQKFARFSVIITKFD